MMIKRNLIGKLAIVFLGLTMIQSCSTAHRGYESSSNYKTQKREFRGAWMPTIYRNEYAELSRREARDLLASRIAILHRTGCNALIFQVRAESDAWYRSSYEPWSKYLSGKQGEAPEGSWDPLAFVLEEAHKYGMEVHAWINPYRGASDATQPLDVKHPAHRYPSWFVRYGNQLILDPGQPEGRAYICNIIKDIVLRYDVDAIHLDDYFYPYPVAGQEFPDEESFSKYGLSVGYRPENKDSWRRNNVNLLIHDISRTLRQTKPWVRLGVSPFGIYRNKQTHFIGSQTAGLQAYDDLYADVLHWANEGWIDYVVPQIYWNIGTKVADYEVLVHWWRQHLKNKHVHLYIGQDIKRTMDVDQLEEKLLLSQTNSEGNVLWPADELFRNYQGISEKLRQRYMYTKALLPEYRGALGKTKAPQPISMLWEDFNEDGHMIVWEDMHRPSDPETPFFYVVYAFPKGEKVSVNNHKSIVSISTTPQYKLPSLDGQTQYTILVTAVNRFWQESEPRKIKIRL